MTQVPITAPGDPGAVGRLGARIAGRPLLTIVGLYLVLRLANLFQMSWVARSADSSLTDMLVSWDGLWLRQAAESGWPVEFALNSGEQSTWAWPPLASLTARALAWLPGLEVPGALVAVNLVTGLLSALMVYAVVRWGLAPRAALIAALLWVAMPASPVFIMGYAEGPFLALVFTSMWFLGRGRPLVASALLVPAGMIKLQVIPFAAAAVLVALHLWWRSSRSLRETVTTVLAVGLAGLSAALWPVIVAVNFGDPRAYQKIQAGWNHSAIPFVDTWNWFVQAFASPNRATAYSLALVVVAIIAGVMVARRSNVPPSVRITGLLLPLFFLATAGGVSMARYLLPDLSIPVFLQSFVRDRYLLAGLGIALLASQVLWIQFFVAAPYGSQPP